MAATEARTVARDVIEARWVTATFDRVVQFTDTQDFGCHPSRRFRRLQDALTELVVLTAGGPEAHLPTEQVTDFVDELADLLHERIVEWTEARS